MSVCTSVSKIGTLSNNTDVLEVTIDNTISALWFYNYAEALAFVNQDVIVEYRQDIYQNELRQFIATFVRPTVVTTLDKTDNIKLYVEQEDNQSNVSFSEIAIGETKPGCIVYCTDCSYKSSPNAVWMELTIRDRSMHIAKLRVFDYENCKVDFKGHYVSTELTHSKYGFQSDLVAPIPGDSIANPEIELALNYIRNYFCDDPIAMQFINKYCVLDVLKELVDYETGYGLMRLAMELDMVASMRNITNDVNLDAISHALLASTACLTKTSVLSPEVNNIMASLSIQWPDREIVLQLLDIDKEDMIPEKKVFNNIKSTVDLLLNIRKGFKE